MKIQAWFLIAALSSVSLAAYAQDSAKSAAAAGPTDPQIAAIVVAANTVDIDAGKQAMKMSTNKEVKGFAQRMVTDHTGVNKQATDLVTKLGVKPEPNDASKGLIKSGEETLKKLSSMKGHDFDKAYVDNEVAYHEAVLGVIKNTLIPNAKNAELKALLVKVAPAIQAHLDHAKHIQASMK